MHTNELTGEVTFDLAGQTFRVHATAARLAEFQAALGVTGLGAMHDMIAHMDLRALFHGLRTLNSSGNADRVNDLPILAHLPTAHAAIVAAMAAGLPDPSGNVEAAGDTT